MGRRYIELPRPQKLLQPLKFSVSYSVACLVLTPSSCVRAAFCMFVRALERRDSWWLSVVEIFFSPSITYVTPKETTTCTLVSPTSCLGRETVPELCCPVCPPQSTIGHTTSEISVHARPGGERGFDMRIKAEIRLGYMSQPTYPSFVAHEFRSFDIL